MCLRRRRQYRDGRETERIGCQAGKIRKPLGKLMKPERAEWEEREGWEGKKWEEKNGWKGIEAGKP